MKNFEVLKNCKTPLKAIVGRRSLKVAGILKKNLATAVSLKIYENFQSNSGWVGYVSASVCQTSMMELFSQNAPSQMFYWLPDTSLQVVLE